jgi:DNA-binding CsgD family transcriptional regulator
VDLRDDIYDALADEEAFKALPAKLANAVSARSATLQVFDRSGAFQEMTFSHFTPAMFDFYVAHEMYHHDIWRFPTEHRAANDRFILVTESVPVDVLTRSIFYNEFLKPFGDDTVHCIGGSFQFPNGSVAIGFHRPYTGTAFDEDDVRSLNSLSGHLKRLFEVRGALSSAAHQLRLTEAALDSSANAVFVVDQAGQPLLINRKSHGLLAENDVLRLTSAGLRARDPLTNQKLVAAFASACGRTHAVGGVLAAPGRAGPPLRIVVTPLVFGGRTRALVVIHDPALRDGLLHAKLRALYDLTPSEAATAVRLARGLAPAEVALDRDVSVPTVRTQIRQVLGKMNAKGIPELVALVVTIPAEG